MTFNPDDQTKAPFRAGIMALSHDECIYVKENCAIVEAGYKPVEPWDNPTASKTYIISNYNKIDDQQKAINGDTYDCLQGYNIELNKDGISENGIVIQPESPAE